MVEHEIQMVNLRIPRGLLQRIDAVAERERRSRHAQILLMLEEDCEAFERAQPDAAGGR